MGILVPLSRSGGGSVPYEYGLAWTRTVGVLCEVECMCGSFYLNP